MFLKTVLYALSLSLIGSDWLSLEDAFIAFAKSVLAGLILSLSISFSTQSKHFPFSSIRHPQGISQTSTAQTNVGKLLKSKKM